MMESDQRRVISLLVDNQSGVLARVSNLFCRRGFNIDTSKLHESGKEV